MILKAAGIDHLNLDVKNWSTVFNKFRMLYKKCTEHRIEFYYGDD